MSLLEALILGIVQGLTEFFPVSSSAHLKIAKWFLGVPDGEHLIFFDLLCHAGTLLALVIYLRRDVWEILKSPRKMAVYMAAIIPLVPAYFFLKPLRVAMSDPSYLGFCLMATAGLLFAASAKQTAIPSEAPLKKWRDVLCIGLMQTMALIPGISRSGSTIAAARFCGWEWREAARFSFLLAIPTVLGGELLETAKMLGGSSEAAGAVSPLCYAAGFAASFGLGLAGVRLIFWLYEKGRVRPFAWYCLGAGLFAWAIFRG